MNQLHYLDTLIKRAILPKKSMSNHVTEEGLPTENTNQILFLGTIAVFWIKEILQKPTA